MQFMDLTINGETIFTGAACFNLEYIGAESYQNYTGAFYFTDLQGNTAPEFAGFGTRYAFVYVNGAGILFTIALQPVPSQTLSTIVDGQNAFIALYELDIDPYVTAPGADAMPSGFDEGYARQLTLAPYPGYVLPGYWEPAYEGGGYA